MAQNIFNLSPNDRAQYAELLRERIYSTITLLALVVVLWQHPSDYTAWGVIGTIIGTVGALQFEVIQYRLEHEYGAKCRYENLNVHKACWVKPKDPKSAEFAEFKRVKAKFLAKDKRGQLVFFADSSFTLQMTQSKYPNVKLHFVSEYKSVT